MFVVLEETLTHQAIAHSSQISVEKGYKAGTEHTTMAIWCERKKNICCSNLSIIAGSII